MLFTMFLLKCRDLVNVLPLHKSNDEHIEWCAGLDPEEDLAAFAAAELSGHSSEPEDDPVYLEAAPVQQAGARGRSRSAQAEAFSAVLTIRVREYVF